MAKHQSKSTAQERNNKTRRPKKEFHPFTKDSAVSMIEAHGGKVEGRSISLARAGLKILSAIDYLVNHHKFIWVRG